MNRTAFSITCAIVLAMGTNSFAQTPGLTKYCGKSEAEINLILDQLTDQLVCASASSTLECQDLTGIGFALGGIGAAAGVGALLKGNSRLCGGAPGAGAHFFPKLHLIEEAYAGPTCTMRQRPAPGIQKLEAQNLLNELDADLDLKLKASDAKIEEGKKLIRKAAKDDAMARALSELTRTQKVDSIAASRIYTLTENHRKNPVARSTMMVDWDDVWPNLNEDQKKFVRDYVAKQTADIEKEFVGNFEKGRLDEIRRMPSDLETRSPRVAEYLKEVENRRQLDQFKRGYAGAKSRLLQIGARSSVDDLRFLYDVPVHDITKATPESLNKIVAAKVRFKNSMIHYLGPNFASWARAGKGGVAGARGWGAFMRRAAFIGGPITTFAELALADGSLSNRGGCAELYGNYATMNEDCSEYVSAINDKFVEFLQLPRDQQLLEFTRYPHFCESVVTTHESFYGKWQLTCTDRGYRLVRPDDPQTAIISESSPAGRRLRFLDSKFGSTMDMALNLDTNGTPTTLYTRNRNLGAWPKDVREFNIEEDLKNKNAQTRNYVAQDWKSVSNPDNIDRLSQRRVAVFNLQTIHRTNAESCCSDKSSLPDGYCERYAMRDARTGSGAGSAAGKSSDVKTKTAPSGPTTRGRVTH